MQVKDVEYSYFENWSIMTQDHYLFRIKNDTIAQRLLYRAAQREQTQPGPGSQMKWIWAGFLLGWDFAEIRLTCGPFSVILSRARA